MCNSVTNSLKFKVSFHIKHEALLRKWVNFQSCHRVKKLYIKFYENLSMKPSVVSYLNICWHLYPKTIRYVIFSEWIGSGFGNQDFLWVLYRYQTASKSAKRSTGWVMLHVYHIIVNCGTLEEGIVILYPPHNISYTRVYSGISKYNLFSEMTPHSNILVPYWIRLSKVLTEI